MKIRLYLFTAGFSAILILSGCAEVGPVTDQNTQNAQNNRNAQINQGGSLSITGTEQFEGMVTQEVISEADQAAYAGAKQLSDATMCDKISNEKFRQQCKTDLADRAVQAEAELKMDKSVCEKMSTKDRQEACKINIDVIMKEQENSQKKAEAMATAYDKLNAVTATADYTQCKTLQDQSFIDTCESNILTNKAMQTGDVTFCEKITNKDNQVTCKSLTANSSQTPQ